MVDLYDGLEAQVTRGAAARRPRVILAYTLVRETSSMAAFK